VYVAIHIRLLSPQGAALMRPEPKIDRKTGIRGEESNQLAFDTCVGESGLPDPISDLFTSGRCKKIHGNVATLERENMWLHFEEIL